MEKLLAHLNAERGRRNDLAGHLSISPSAISMWERVPAERVLDVERITGVSRHELRPDLYPIASSSPEAA